MGMESEEKDWTTLGLLSFWTWTAFLFTLFNCCGKKKPLAHQPGPQPPSQPPPQQQQSKPLKPNTIEDMCQNSDGCDFDPTQCPGTYDVINPNLTYGTLDTSIQNSPAIVNKDQGAAGEQKLTSDKSKSAPPVLFPRLPYGFQFANVPGVNFCLAEEGRAVVALQGPPQGHIPGNNLFGVHPSPVPPFYPNQSHYPSSNP